MIVCVSQCLHLITIDLQICSSSLRMKDILQVPGKKSISHLKCLRQDQFNTRYCTLHSVTEPCYPDRVYWQIN